MHEHEPAQEAELRDGKVRGVRRLEPLLAADADADLGALDHPDVVGAVADRERHGRGGDARAHHLHDERLLLRGHAARDDGLAAARDGQQRVLRVLVPEDVRQRLSGHDDAYVGQDLHTAAAAATAGLAAPLRLELLRRRRAGVAVLARRDGVALHVYGEGGGRALGASGEVGAGRGRLAETEPRAATT